MLYITCIYLQAYVKDSKVAFQRPHIGREGFILIIIPFIVLMASMAGWQWCIGECRLIVVVYGTMKQNIGHVYEVRSESLRKIR